MKKKIGLMILIRALGHIEFDLGGQQAHYDAMQYNALITTTLILGEKINELLGVPFSPSLLTITSSYLRES